MVIEHQFVTTLDGPQAMRLASDFLTSRGFAVKGQHAFAVGGGWNTLEVSRGQANAAKAKSIAELPQRLRMEWDRGRVTVAAALEYHAAGSFTIAGGGSGAEPPAGSPKLRLHTEMLLGIVRGLELLLVHRASPEQAALEWAGAEHRIIDEAARVRRRRQTTLGIVMACVIGLVMLVIVIAALNE